MNLLERKFEEKVSLKEGPGAGYDVDCKNIVPSKPVVHLVGYSLKEDALEFTYVDTRVYGDLVVSGYDWGAEEKRVLFDKVYAEGGLSPSGSKDILSYLLEEPGFLEAIVESDSDLVDSVLEKYNPSFSEEFSYEDFLDGEFYPKIYKEIIIDLDMESREFQKAMQKSKFDPTKFILKFGDPFSGMREMIGGGYQHKRMPDYFQLTSRGDVYTEEQSFYITEAQIDSKEVAQIVEYAHENQYSDEDDDDEDY